MFKYPVVTEITLLADSLDERELHYFDVKKCVIPKGTKLQVECSFSNYYGRFYRCKYNGELYDISFINASSEKIEFRNFIGDYPDFAMLGLSRYERDCFDPRDNGYQELKK